MAVRSRPKSPFILAIGSCNELVIMALSTRSSLSEYGSSMLSDYLTANSIFVAVLGLLVSRESLHLPIIILTVLLCMFGLLLCLQMAIVLGHSPDRTRSGNGNCAGSSKTQNGLPSYS